MLSVFSANVVCFLLLFLLAPETLGDKQFKSYQKSIGRRVRAKATDIRRNSENTCTKFSNQYDSKIDVLECDAAYVEAVRKDEDNTCGNPYGAANIAKCGTYNGTVCAVLDDYSELQNILRRCFDLSDEIYRLPSECETGCALALRRLSDRIGCCIHTIKHTTILRTPSLWMNCGVERPEPCADTPKFAKPFDRSSLTCGYEYHAFQYYYTYCKYLGEELSKINMECGYPEEDTMKRCGYDKGKYCGILNTPDQKFLSIYDKCISFFEETTSGSCNDECRDAIQDLKDTYGCCVITFNAAYSWDVTASQVLSSDLWASCSIEIPKNCIASSLNQLRPPDESLKCGTRGSMALPVMIYSTLLMVIGIATY